MKVGLGPTDSVTSEIWHILAFKDIEFLRDKLEEVKCFPLPLFEVIVFFLLNVFMVKINT